MPDHGLKYLIRSQKRPDSGLKWPSGLKSLGQKPKSPDSGLKQAYQGPKKAGECPLKSPAQWPASQCPSVTLCLGDFLLPDPCGLALPLPLTAGTYANHWQTFFQSKQCQRSMER